MFGLLGSGFGGITMIQATYNFLISKGKACDREAPIRASSVQNDAFLPYTDMGLYPGRVTRTLDINKAS